MTRILRFVPPVLVLLLGLAPLHAAAECYTVFDHANRIIYRDLASPVDLSGSVADAMRARFPNAHLVISGDNANCTPIVPGSPVETRGAAVAAEPAYTKPAVK